MAQSHGLGIGDVSRTVTAILITLLMCVTGVASSANGQGTSGLFSDLISLVELTDLLESNGVVYRDGYAAIETAHMKYLAKSAELRENKIAAVQKRVESLTDTGLQLRDPVEAQKIMDACRTVMTQSEEHEMTLFEAVKSALPKEAHSGVERSRATRERKRLQPPDSLGSFSDAPIVDVPVILRALQWKDVANGTVLLAECEVALGDYDDRQTKLLRKALAKALVVPVEMMKLMESGAFNEEESDDPADIEQRASLNEALVKVLAPLVEARAAARESTTRAFRVVRAVLALRDGQTARAFRKTYLAQAYPTISPTITNDFELQATTALRVMRLNADQRAAIRSIHQQWQVQDDRFIDEHVVVQERLMARLSATVGAFDATFYSGLVDEQAALEAKQAKCAETALRAIESVVGADMPALFDKVGTHEESDLFLPVEQVNLVGAVTGPLDVVADGGELAQVQCTAGLSLWFDNRMNDDWMDRISGAIGVEPGPRATLDSLKEDYWRAWETRIAPMIEEMSRSFVVERPADAAALPAVNVLNDDADVAEWVAKANATQREMRELEDQLFADVQSVVAQPNQAAVIEMLRVGRRCGERVNLLDALFDNVEGGEENANVILAATRVQLSPADCAKVAQALAPKLAGLQASAERLRAVMVDSWRMRRLNEVAWANYAKVSDTSRWGEVWRGMQAQDEALRSAGLAAANEKAARQREAFDAVIAVLPESARKPVRGEFLRDAYFGAVGANEQASEALARACKLVDLTEAQRGALSIARSEYGDERDAAVALMIEHMKSDPVKRAPNGEGANGVTDGAEADAETQREAMRQWMSQRAQIEQIERYAFARDAARDKLLMRLKNTLNEEQLRRAGIK
ncbi:MAG: hypothetical protein EXS17_05150 [Phycisphaerales bacterium]|nr:hypothetical protein [Phycisphaerales bacterium]